MMATKKRLLSLFCVLITIQQRTTSMHPSVVILGRVSIDKYARGIPSESALLKCKQSIGCGLQEEYNWFDAFPDLPSNRLTLLVTNLVGTRSFLGQMFKLYTEKLIVFTSPRPLIPYTLFAYLKAATGKHVNHLPSFHFSYSSILCLWGCHIKLVLWLRYWLGNSKLPYPLTITESP